MEVNIMITNCAGKCNRKVIAKDDNKAYLCRTCYASLMNLLLDIIRPAKEPHLEVVKPTIDTPEEVPAA
jgi:hypothetical protein